MSGIAQPHDKFLRKLLEQPEAAAALLRERLPRAIARRLGPDPLQLVEGTFIDPGLRLSQSDRLFRARLRDGREAFIYCLIEHKSAPEPWLALQLLRYLTQVWLRLSRELPGGALLPPVFPLVIYNGVERWQVPRDFHGLIDADRATKNHVLNFRSGLVELAGIPDGELSREPHLRAGLLILKHVIRAAGTREEEEVLAGILASLRELEWDFIEAAFAYIMNEFHLDWTAFEAAVRRGMPVQEAQMLTIAAQLKAEGRAEGKAEGRTEGKAEGKAEALLRLLERRFRAVPDSRRHEIGTASLSELDRWFDRALDAASLEDVFACSPH